MADISRGVHSGVAAVLGLVAVVIICLGLQAVVPNRTVRPLAARFLCDGGSAQIIPRGEQSGTALLTRVDCNTAGPADDVTNGAFAILTIPCALALATAGMLIKRLVLSAPRTTTRRAPA